VCTADEENAACPGCKGFQECVLDRCGDTCKKVCRAKECLTDGNVYGPEEKCALTSNLFCNKPDDAGVSESACGNNGQYCCRNRQKCNPHPALYTHTFHDDSNTCTLLNVTLT